MRYEDKTGVPRRYNLVDSSSVGYVDPADEPYITQLTRMSANNFSAGIDAAQGVVQKALGFDEAANANFQEFGRLSRRAQQFGPEIQSWDDVEQQGVTAGNVGAYLGAQVANMVPDIGLALTGAGVGAVVGRRAAVSGARALATEFAETEAGKLAAREAAEATTKRLAAAGVADDVVARNAQMAGQDAARAAFMRSEAGQKAAAATVGRGQFVGATAAGVPSALNDERTVELAQQGDAADAVTLFAGGVAQATLDTLPFLRALDKIGGQVTGETVKNTADRFAKRFAKEVGTQALFEGSTELAQEAIKNTSHALVTGNPELLYNDQAIKNYIVSFATGAVLGGALGGGIEAGGAAGRQVQRTARQTWESTKNFFANRLRAKAGPMPSPDPAVQQNQSQADSVVASTRTPQDPAKVAKARERYSAGADNARLSAEIEARSEAATRWFNEWKRGEADRRFSLDGFSNAIVRASGGPEAAVNIQMLSFVDGIDPLVKQLRATGGDAAAADFLARGGSALYRQFTAPQTLTEQDAALVAQLNQYISPAARDAMSSLAAEWQERDSRVQAVYAAEEAEADPMAVAAQAAEVGGTAPPDERQIDAAEDDGTSRFSDMQQDTEATGLQRFYAAQDPDVPGGRQVRVVTRDGKGEAERVVAFDSDEHKQALARKEAGEAVDVRPVSVREEAHAELRGPFKTLRNGKLGTRPNNIIERGSSLYGKKVGSNGVLPMAGDPDTLWDVAGATIQKLKDDRSLFLENRTEPEGYKAAFLSVIADAKATEFPADLSALRPGRYEISKPDDSKVAFEITQQDLAALGEGRVQGPTRVGQRQAPQVLGVEAAAAQRAAEVFPDDPVKQRAATQVLVARSPRAAREAGIFAFEPDEESTGAADVRYRDGRQVSNRAVRDESLDVADIATDGGYLVERDTRLGPGNLPPQTAGRVDESQVREKARALLATPPKEADDGTVYFEDPQTFARMPAPVARVLTTLDGVGLKRVMAVRPRKSRSERTPGWYVRDPETNELYRSETKEGLEEVLREAFTVRELAPMSKEDKDRLFDRARQMYATTEDVTGDAPIRFASLKAGFDPRFQPPEAVTTAEYVQARLFMRQREALGKFADDFETIAGPVFKRTKDGEPTILAVTVMGRGDSRGVNITYVPADSETNQSQVIKLRDGGATIYADNRFIDDAPPLPPFTHGYSFKSETLSAAQKIIRRSQRRATTGESTASLAYNPAYDDSPVYVSVENLDTTAAGRDVLNQLDTTLDNFAESDFTAEFIAGDDGEILRRLLTAWHAVKSDNGRGVGENNLRAALVAVAKVARGNMSERTYMRSGGRAEDLAYQSLDILASLDPAMKKLVDWADKVAGREGEGKAGDFGFVYNQLKDSNFPPDVTSALMAYAPYSEAKQQALAFVSAVRDAADLTGPKSKFSRLHDAHDYGTPDKNQGPNAPTEKALAEVAEPKPRTVPPPPADPAKRAALERNSKAPKNKWTERMEAAVARARAARRAARAEGETTVQMGAEAAEPFDLTGNKLSGGKPSEAKTFPPGYRAQGSGASAKALGAEFIRRPAPKEESIKLDFPAYGSVSGRLRADAMEAANAGDSDTSLPASLAPVPKSTTAQEVRAAAAAEAKAELARIRSLPPEQRKAALDAKTRRLSADLGAESVASAPAGQHDLAAEGAYVQGILRGMGFAPAAVTVEANGADLSDFAGEMRINPDGSITVSMGKGLVGPERIEVLQHEIGHAVVLSHIAKLAGVDLKALLGPNGEMPSLNGTMRALEAADPKLYAALKADYDQWLTANASKAKGMNNVLGSRGGIARAGGRRARGGAGPRVRDMDQAQVESLVSMEEWIADGVVRALNRNTEAKGITEKFFSELADMLRKAYEKVRELFGMTTATPPSIESWVNGMFDAEAKRLGPTTAAGRREIVMRAAHMLHRVRMGLPADPDAIPSDETPLYDLTIDDLVSDYAEIIRFGLSPEQRGILNRVLSRPEVDAELRQTLSLLNPDPELLAALDDAQIGPEARMAAAMLLQASPKTKLRLGPNASNVIAGLIERVEGWMGAASDADYAIALLDAATRGRFDYAAAANKDPDATERAEFDHVAAHADALRAAGQSTRALVSEGANKKNGWFQKIADAYNKVVGQSVYERAEALNVPSLRRLVSMLYKPGDVPGADKGLIRSVEHKVSVEFDKTTKTLRDLSTEQKNAALDILQRMAPSDEATDPQVQAAVDALRKQLAEYDVYARKAGVKYGYQRDFFPVVMDVESEEASARLTALLSAPNFERGMREFFNALAKARKETAIANGVEGAERWSDTDDRSVAELVDDMVAGAKRDAEFASSYDDNPRARGAQHRSMAFVYKDGTPEQIAEFAALQSKDVAGIVASYIEPMTRKAEHARRYGNGRLERLMARAKQEGATPEDLQFARDAIAAAMGTYGSGGSPVLSMVSKSMAQKLHGRGTQNAISNVMMYNNIRLLPLAMLSSLVDPVLIAVRSGGDLGNAFDGIRAGLRAQFDGASKEETARMIDQLGAAADFGAEANLLYALGGLDQAPTARKWNDRLFRYNGMSWLAKATRHMAMHSAHGFLARHATRPNEHSERYLRELGLKPGDVQVEMVMNPQGRMVERVKLDTGRPEVDARVKDAIVRFIDDAVLRPNPIQSPLWHADPYMGLVTQYKGFLYAMWDQVGRRISTEVKNNNALGMFVALLAYAPVAIMAMLMREQVQYGENGNPNRADWDVEDYTAAAFYNSGMFGPSSALIGSVYDDVTSARIPLVSQLGPSANQATDVVATVAGQRNAGETLQEAAPLSVAWEKRFGTEAARSGGGSEPVNENAVERVEEDATQR